MSLIICNETLAIIAVLMIEDCHTVERASQLIEKKV